MDGGRRGGPPYLGHGLRWPNFVPKFGASVRSSAPTDLRGTGAAAGEVTPPYGWLRKASASARGSWRIAERLRQRGRGRGGNWRKDHQNGDESYGFP